MQGCLFFDIVITLYNKKNYICELLKACLNLAEICNHIGSIIIIDDSSTDSSWHVVSAFIKNCESSMASRFVTRKLPVNLGAQAARMKGIELTESEWVILIDGDDLIYPCSIARVCDYILEHQASLEHIMLVYGNCPRVNSRVTFDHIKNVPKTAIECIRINSGFGYTVRNGRYPLMSGLFIRRQCAELMKYSKISLGEDMLFFFELMQYSPFLYLDIDIALWRRGIQDGSTIDSYTLEKHKQFIEYLFKINVYRNTKSITRAFEATIIRFILVISLLRSVIRAKWTRGSTIHPDI